jgi:nucleoside-diphosphate-sugar epimerase
MIYNNNIFSTINLLNSLIFKPKIFIFISSVAVYGILSGDSISEKSPLLAKDSYGLSKIHSEDLIINWCTQNNVKYLILRLPLLVGSNPKGNLKKMINAIKNNYYFEIDNGKAKKSMLLAEDLANNILRISQYEGIYNLTDGYHPSFHEIAKKYATLLNKDLNYNFSIKQATYLAKIGNYLGSNFIFNTNKLLKITSNLTFDDSLAQNILNWKPNLVLNKITL